MPRKARAAPSVRLRDLLAALEAGLHRPEPGASRRRFEAMMAREFCEVGASGRRYSRAQVLEVLERRIAAGPRRERWETSDVGCCRVAPGVYLLTYTLVQGGGRRTRRSSIWRRAGAAWKILFHQGTLIDAGG